LASIETDSRRERGEDEKGLKCYDYCSLLHAGSQDNMLNENRPNPQAQKGNGLDPIGLKLEFRLEDQIALTNLTLNGNHQGLPGQVHDGILAFLMDEGMGWIARHGAGVNSVTAKLEVNFHNRAKIGDPLIMKVRILRNTSRLLEEEARIEGQDGTLIAEGNCLQYITRINRAVD
jgi:acyl-coenzyme A thioesterase PaaI-like protein